MVGKALDDRVPLAVITEVLRRVPLAERGCELTLACTVQEEVGLIGAFALAARERFDAAIVVEIGMAGDIPGVDERMMPLRLGGGPVLVHKDALVHYDYALTQRLEQVAQGAGIPIQHAIFGSFGSDGAALMKADIPAALVAFHALHPQPVRDRAPRRYRGADRLDRRICARRRALEQSVNYYSFVVGFRPTGENRPQI